MIQGSTVCNLIYISLQRSYHKQKNWDVICAIFLIDNIKSILLCRSFFDFPFWGNQTMHDNWNVLIVSNIWWVGYNAVHFTIGTTGEGNCTIPILCVWECVIILWNCVLWGGGLLKESLLKEEIYLIVLKRVIHHLYTFCPLSFE